MFINLLHCWNYLRFTATLVKWELYMWSSLRPETPTSSWLKFRVEILTTTTDTQTRRHTECKRSMSVVTGRKQICRTGNWEVKGVLSALLWRTCLSYQWLSHWNSTLKGSVLCTLFPLCILFPTDRPDVSSVCVSFPILSTHLDPVRDTDPVWRPDSTVPGSPVSSVCDKEGLHKIDLRR